MESSITHAIDGEYIREWLVLGPFFSDDLNEDFLANAGGEANIDPKKGDIVNTKYGRTLMWKLYESRKDSVDLLDAVGEYEYVTAYAFCELASPDARRTEMLVGSDDGVKVWLNGEMVHIHPDHRGLTLDEDSLAVDLMKGANHCLVKVSQITSEWGFAVRFREYMDYFRSASLDIFLDLLEGKVSRRLEIRVQRVISPPSAVWSLINMPVGIEISSYQGEVIDSFSVEEGQPYIWSIPSNMWGNVTIAAELTDEAGRRINTETTAPTQAKRTSSQQWTRYTMADGLPPGTIYAIHEDREGNLWFGTERGVCRFDGSHFRTFTQEDGLALKGDREGEVYSIIQDSTGYLWFGTCAGASRFDGQTFRNFTMDDGLAYNIVNAIYEDSVGNLWFGTGNFWWGGGDGISRYDGSSFQTFTFDQLGFPAEVRISNGEAPERARMRQVLDITEDGWGDLWFATQQGLCRYDGQTFRTYTNYNVLHHNIVLSICRDKSGHLWFVDRLGYFYEYDGENIHEHFRIYEKAFATPILEVKHTIQDRQGSFWFAIIERGVKKYDGSIIESYTMEDGLPNNTVYSICQDTSGDLWFGTEDGVARYDSTSFRNYTEQDGLNGLEVRAIYRDSHNRIWAVNQNTIIQFDGKRFHTVKRGWPYGWLASIYEDRSGRLWFGRTSLYAKYDGNTWQTFTGNVSTISIPLSFFEDSQGRIWFIPGHQGIDYHDGVELRALTSDDGLVPGAIVTVCEDAEGNMWFGSSGNGACRYDGQRFTVFTEADGLANDNVNWIFKDRVGSLWFATENGVSRYDGQRFEKFGTEHGLGHDRVHYVYQDSRGFIWLCTRRGITRYDGERFQTFTSADGLGYGHGDMKARWDTARSILEDRSGNIWFIQNGEGIAKYDGTCFQTFSTKDGLASNVVTSIVEDDEGNLWLATGNGITKHVPDRVPPRVTITGIIADRKYPAEEGIVLSSSANRTTFTYQGADFRTRPGQMWYLYQLEGLDADWQKPTHDEQVDYLALKPGHYTFRIKAVDRDLNYSEPASVKLEVIPDPRNHRIAQLEGELVEREREEMERIYRELEDARQIQQSLLPKEPPQIAGYEIAGMSLPAKEVSGDFYDYLSLGQDVGVVLADVTGKSVKAAMIAAMADGVLHTAVRERGDVWDSPSRILTEVNIGLQPRLIRGMFTAMSLGIICADERKLLFSNAGMPYPVVKRGKEALELEVVGMPLGLMEGAEYQELCTDLEEGDFVVFYSDGVIEATDEAGEMYQTERLLELIQQADPSVSAQEMVDLIVKDVAAFAGAEEASDDITIVVVRCRE